MGNMRGSASYVYTFWGVFFGWQVGGQGSGVALRCVLLGPLAFQERPGPMPTKFLLEFCLGSNYIVVVMSLCHM